MVHFESLNVIGALPSKDKHSVLILGPRICSEYGRYMARMYGKTFAAAGWQVITGLSQGVDGIAARAALREDGAVFAVMGCGADVCYPPENRELYELCKVHGIISAYPDGTAPKRENFEERREILTDLADVVVLIEARRKSGNIKTFEMAREKGKDVYCVPGRCTDRLSDGTNDLIKNGVAMTMDPSDIIERYEMPFC